MFLVKALVVVSVIFWVSAFLAELVMTSAGERRLAPSVRVGLAYFIIFGWFTGAWKLMSLKWAWVLGLVLLAFYTLRRPKKDLDDITRSVKASLKSYFPSFMAFMIGANLFFLPLYVDGNYGPPTEHGGDVSMYADMAKFLVDRNLPVYGYADMVYDLKHYIADPFNAPLTDNADSLAYFDRVKGNPPTADSQVYRVNAVKRYSLIQFVPTGIWFFLADDTNYHIFYGTLAFLYALLLLAVWGFFRKYAIVPAVLAVFIVVSSHGLVSVSYNVYFMQAMCLAISALIINVGRQVRLFSFEGVRTYWIPVGIVTASYTHYMAVLLPLLIVIALFRGKHRAKAKTTPDLIPADGQDTRSRSISSAVLKWGAVSVFSALFFITVSLDILGDIGSYKPVIAGAIQRILTGSDNDNHHMGNPIKVFSKPWLNFFFGSVSQQHVMPLMHPPKMVVKTLTPVVYTGATAIALGIFAWLFSLKEIFWNGNRETMFLLAIYLACMVAVTGHHLITQMSLYTQAKGAQNVLVLLYVAMALPLVAVYRQPKKSKAGIWLKPALFLALAAFGITLLLPRAALAVRLGRSMDASGILEASFFSEAKRIRKLDSNPFVWFEPQRNADVYTSIQPFAGARMVPTRHLALAVEWVKNKPGEPYAGFEVNWNVSASDLVTDKDLLHLWVLHASKSMQKADFFSDQYARYRWKAEKLVESQFPRLLFSGHYYEPFFRDEKRSENPSDTGRFTYIRQGAVLLYLPAGCPCSIEVKVRTNRNEFNIVAEEIGRRLKNGEFAPGGKMSLARDVITISYQLPSSEKPKLALLAKSDKEILVNVRLNGAELKGEK